MDQPTFSDLEYQKMFLERMDGLIPWHRIHPFYPKAGRGRHPYPLSVMLRTHCVQLFYNLATRAWRTCSTSLQYPQLPPPPGKAQAGAGSFG